MEHLVSGMRHRSELPWAASSLVPRPGRRPPSSAVREAVPNRAVEVRQSRTCLHPLSPSPEARAYPRPRRSHAQGRPPPLQLRFRSTRFPRSSGCARRLLRCGDESDDRSAWARGEPADCRWPTGAMSLHAQSYQRRSLTSASEAKRRIKRATRSILLAPAPNDFLYRETDRQNLAVGVLRSRDHNADRGGARLMAWYGKGAAVEQVDD
jgi:hypothetical protein